MAKSTTKLPAHKSKSSSVRSVITGPAHVVEARYPSALGVDVHAQLLVCAFQRMHDHKIETVFANFETGRSGLAEFAARLASLMKGREVPYYTTLRNHLARSSENITVHTLSEEEIQSAICPQALPTAAGPTDMPTEIFFLRSQSVVIRLAGGTTVKFDPTVHKFMHACIFLRTLWGMTKDLFAIVLGGEASF